ncbi:MAG TPA: flagellar biosynthesis protein FlhF [Spirochaetota bacterium]|nr:flagellar biosynthesis protein FlhF [Spirochaetota bacterium]HPP03761.1 flagellar biosynthesis protein FlhF [Spirochaetota bacterium]
MKYAEIKALSYDDAYIEIRKRYGDNARIVKTFEIKEGGFLGFGRKKYLRVLVSIPDDEYLKIEKENFMNLSKMRNIKQEEKGKSEPNVLNQPSIQTNKLKVEPQNKNLNSDSISLSIIMEKLNKMEKIIKESEINKNDELHPNLVEIKEILKQNEFFDEFIDRVIKDLSDNLPLSKIENRVELHQYVFDYIKNKLVKVEHYNFGDGQKKVITLIGPTGVGKTTTLAKLAANAVIEHYKVRLLTIDGFRLGATNQLEKYADILKVDLSLVEDNISLQKNIALSDADIILIDTIGRGQRDEINLAKMKQILDVKNYNVDFILTLSATTKPAEVKRIFRSFDIFDYKNVIITKYDESETIGSIINCCLDMKKGIMFITDGQRVPNDIQKADEWNILTKIKGLEPQVYLESAKY